VTISSIPEVIPILPDERISEVIGPAAAGKPGSTLLTYLRLQGGGWWKWIAIWALQNIRYLPVYVMPLLIGHLIDRIDSQAPGKALGELPWVLGITVAMCLATIASDTLARVLLSRIGHHLTAGLRAALIQRINRLEFSFHDRSQFGALQNKFTLDVGRLAGLQSYISESLLMYGTVVVVMLAIIATSNVLMLTVLMLVVPINVLLVRLCWNRIQSKNEDYAKAETGYMASLNEALNGLRVNRAHANEEFVESRLSKAADSVASKAIKLDYMNNLFGSASAGVATVLSLVVLALGIWLAVGGERSIQVMSYDFTVSPITVGELTVLMSYYGILSGAMGSIIGGLPAVAAAKDGIRSLSQLFKDEDVESPRDRREIPTLRGDVRFESVFFTYANADHPCLIGLEMNIPAGTSLALVGQSGSGKSTVASLILGFYQPQSGRVLIDDKDLGLIDRRSLRRHVGVVGQEVVLFQDSILANIAWGDQHPDFARVQNAAQRANAMEFIERLPGGLGHVLGDRGAGLSGGQRQRLAIARAIYRDPQLLILDEATSALDQESEQLVQKALDELRRGRATLIIAHRLSTVRTADSIAVLHEGCIIEQGRFDELMAKDGPFKRLAHDQLV